MPRRLRSFRGVFVPSLTAILGAAIFLILPRLTGQAGLLTMAGCILLAHAIVLCTGFSLADFATNLNHIESGGLYTLARLSLGNALGGTIGIQLFIAQAMTAGFFCIGFAAPLRSLTESFLPALLQQEPVLASILAGVVFLLTLTGADFTGRIQLAVVGVLVLSLTVLFLSPLMGVSWKGENLYSPQINLWGTGTASFGLFFLVFAQFFPAVTGTTSGISRIGDLVNPRRSLVNGVFSVIMVTLVIYLAAAFLFSFARPFPSDLSGIVSTLGGRVPIWIILAGFFATTGYSTLNLFQTAPDTLKSLAADSNIPRFLRFLGNDFRPGGKVPRFGMLLSLGIVLLVIWLTDLQLAARLVGIQFLTVYAWLNGAAFLERFSRNPGFRPTFRNHWSISLLGFLACLVSLFFIDWKLGLILMIVQLAIFQLLLSWRSGGSLEGVLWGIYYTLSIRSLSRMRKIMKETRNWRPVVDAFSFSDSGSWETIADFSHRIGFRNGLVRFNLLKPPRKNGEAPDIGHLRIPAGVIETGDPALSVITMVQSCQLGGVESNTVLLDFNSRIDNLRILKTILNTGKNILLMVNGYKFRTCESLDIWWRGERNGNLMVMLAFILNRSLQEKNTPPFHIRVIRKLDLHEDQANAAESMEKLLKLARLAGEVIILPGDKSPFSQTLERVSHSASLIMMGLPGNFIEQDSDRIRLFNLDEFFFTRELHTFDRMPPILFVKSAQNMTITDD
jgi:amino acid transporter